MGTRADFYVGRGAEASWMGSIAWDGYPEGIPDEIRKANDEHEFKASVVQFVKGREDGTMPEMGWPWPWSDSGTTDFAYAFNEGRVWASCFGREWFPATGDAPDMDGGKVAVFPDMSRLQRTTFGKRSGIMFIGADGPVEQPE